MPAACITATTDHSHSLFPKPLQHNKPGNRVQNVISQTQLPGFCVARRSVWFSVCGVCLSAYCCQLYALISSLLVSKENFSAQAEEVLTSAASAARAAWRRHAHDVTPLRLGPLSHAASSRDRNMWSLVWTDSEEVKHFTLLARVHKRE